MVDETRVRRLLHALAEELDFLDREAAASAERRRDPAVRRGVKYALATGIEACVDIAQHICASEGWGPPNDNGHAMIVIGRHGVLSHELADRMRQAVGFRHVLVREYVAVDEALVAARLADHRDLVDFGSAITAFVAPD